MVVIAYLYAVGLGHLGHLVQLMGHLDGLLLVAEVGAGPDDGLAAKGSHLLDYLLGGLGVDRDYLEPGLLRPLLDVLHGIVQVHGQQLHAVEAQGLDGLELLQQRGAKA